MRSRPCVRIVKALLGGVVALGQFLLFLPVTARPVSADFVIASEGQPRATLIVSPQASAFEGQALGELSSYFQRICGAQLPIAQGDATAASPGTSPILIGRAAVEFGHLRMTRREFTEDGFTLKVQNGALLVAGAGPRGALLAAYRLLQEVGCRWFFPGEFGEVVPNRPTVLVPDLDISSKPDIAHRYIAVDGTDEATSLWALRNGLSVGGPLTAKSVEELVPPEEFFADHPEFYALVDGVRRPPHLCLSNPQVLEIAASRVVQFFRRNPQAEELPLFYPDPEGFCQDEGCQSLDVGEVDPVTGFASATDRALKFANALAQKVGQEMPGKYLLFLASGPTVAPPRRERVDQAVVPVLSSGAFCPFHSPSSRACLPAQILDSYLRRWCTVSSQVRVVLQEPIRGARGLPFPRGRFLGETMRYLRERGVQGVDLVGDGSWVASGLNRYLAARLLWDTSLDVSSISGDFYDRFYGESGGAVRAFSETLEAAVGGGSLHRADDVAAPLVFSPQLMSLLSWRLQSANEAAVLSTTKHHLELPNFQFRYLSAFLTMRERSDAGRFVEALRFADYASRILQQMSAGTGGTPVSQSEVLADIKSNLAESVARAGQNGEAVLAFLPTSAKFKTDGQGVGEAEEWFAPEEDDSGWSMLSSAYPWELQGFEGYHGNAFYRVSFRLGQVSPGGRYFLRLSGVFGSPSVYLNGVFVGRKMGPSPPLLGRAPLYGVEFDVTGLLASGQVNLLTAKVSQPAPNSWSGLYGPVFIYGKSP